MPSSFKKIISAFVLASFLAIALLSFTFMMTADGRMAGNCPFSVMGASLCPQGTLALAVHHISAYRSFFNVFVNSGITVIIIFALLFALRAIFNLATGPPSLSRPLIVTGGLHDSPPVISHKRKITHWLALLENSPSLV